ncbi:MAG: hypothetical protein IPL35_16145 [Sphingobacteriales bacterium]|nr:hypothetical protein [Sphingobacteriales bacterium]
MIFILLGVLLSVAILFQVSVHNTETLDTYSNDGQNLFLFAPLLSIALGVYFIYKATIQEINETFERKYSNKILNYLNNFLATKSRNPFWIFLLMFPVFFMVTLILILFGQDSNSIIKVFTDTATWKLSQQTHPPILEHTTGHYLCTVAAAGHPKIVKPIRFGQRNGKTIIVNRQLLIANAFEELIQDVSPKAHYFIRTCYDKYGYNLSKKINTVALSNTTYILMKPLEWVFLICLYLFCNKPEQKNQSSIHCFELTDDDFQKPVCTKSKILY